MRYLVTLAGVLASLVTMASLQASPADKTTGWGPLQSLVGDWIGEGGGGPGQGAGSFSFKPDLQGKILLRKNRAEYPAVKRRLCARSISIAKGIPFGMMCRRRPMAARSSS
jgi:hypothetical protein